MTDIGVVGRDDEMQRLGRFLDRALGGETSVCMVTGEPGAGKSFLLQQFLGVSSDRHPHILVAIGECNSVGESGDPYLPFREILGDLTGAASDGAGGPDIRAPTGSRLGSFFQSSAQVIAEHGPDLVDIFVPGAALAARLGEKAARRLSLRRRSRLAGTDSTMIDPHAIGQENIFEQYVQVLRAIAAERPLLLVIDDLHWADTGSAGLLFHLARRLVSDPILLLGAYRAEELRQGRDGQPHPMAPIVAELKRIHGEIQVDLDAHDPESFINALLESRPNQLDAMFRRELLDHTAGNPLFAVELLRSLEASGVIAADADGRMALAGSLDWSALPTRVEGVIESRVEQINAEQREILDIAAVQGQEFSADVIARVLGQPRRPTIKALSGALQRDYNIVSAIGSQTIGSCSVAAYRFRHQLFRQYLYDQLDENERTDLHLEIGGALETLHVGDETEVAVALAYHFMHTPDWKRTLRYTVLAADRARDAMAPKEAAAYYEKALSILDEHPDGQTEIDHPRHVIAERRGDQLELLGEHEPAIAEFTKSIEMMQDAPAFDRSRIFTKLSIPLQRLRRYQEAVAALDSAERTLPEAAPDQGSERWRAWIDIGLERAYMYYWQGDASTLRALNEALRPIIEQHGSKRQKLVLAASLIRWGLRQTRYRPGQDLADVCQAAIDAQQESTSDASRMDAYFQLGFVLLHMERFDQAADAFRRSLDLYKRCGDLVLRLRTMVYLSVAYRRLKQPEKVVKILDTAETLARQIGAFDYQGLLLAQRAWLALRAGNRERADELSLEAMAIWNTGAPKYPFKWLALWIRIDNLVAAHEWDAAASIVRQLNEPTQARPPAVLDDVMEDMADADGAVSHDALIDALNRAVDLARRTGLI